MKLLIAGAGFIVQDWLQITKDLPEIQLTGIAGTEKDLSTMQITITSKTFIQTMRQP